MTVCWVPWQRKTTHLTARKPERKGQRSRPTTPSKAPISMRPKSSHRTSLPRGTSGDSFQHKGLQGPLKLLAAAVASLSCCWFWLSDCRLAATGMEWSHRVVGEYDSQVWHYNLYKVFIEHSSLVQDTSWACFKNIPRFAC